MPTLTIPDEIFQRLARRAATLNLTVEQLIVPLLEIAAANTNNGHAPTAPDRMTFDEWKKHFDAWMTEVQARAGRYPPGFAMDDSRESIYEGCGQ